MNVKIIIARRGTIAFLFKNSWSRTIRYNKELNRRRKGRKKERLRFLKMLLFRETLGKLLD